LLETVFLNGNILRQNTLAEIRERAELALSAPAL
jgi:hypothetical protein